MMSTKEAEYLKQQGDEHSHNGDFLRAAEAYGKALSGDTKFSHADRLEMATVIAWGGNIDRAKKELGDLLAENPDDLKARHQLSRVLFWSGEIDGSQYENEKVLAKDSNDRAALFLKGDILRIKGELDKAISVYQFLLKNEEGFDVRNSLAYAYLAAGNTAEAKRNFDLLVPVYLYQRQEVERLQGAIVSAEKPRAVTQEDPSLQAKAAGDQLASEENFQAAADEYSKALGFSNSFNADERLQMARVMSWGGRLKDAQRELEKILSFMPSFKAARIQLARVLLWSGELDVCLQEIDRVLVETPKDRDALLVRANAFRLKRNLRAAIPLCHDLIKEADDYDTREGLTYAYIANRDRIATDKSLPSLYPSYPYQKKSLSELKTLRDRQFNPSVSPGFTFYDDSNDNQVSRYFVNGTAWVENWMLNLGYFHTHATSPGLTKDADDVLLSTYSRMPFYGGFGASIGLSNPGGYVIGDIRGDLDIPDGSLGVNFATYLMRDTAQLIEKRMRVLASSFYASYRPTDRVGLFGSYAYNTYSDSNYSNAVNVSASYITMRQPLVLSVGYRFRYLDFNKQTGSGYFDPKNFFSNAGFVRLSFDQSRFYGFVEPFLGYQTYSRYNRSYNEFIFGGACLLGYRFTERLALELRGEGSNGGISVSGAYNYYQVGAGIRYTF